MDIPKSALSDKAVPNASATMPTAYAISVYKVLLLFNYSRPASFRFPASALSSSTRFPTSFSIFWFASLAE